MLGNRMGLAGGRLASVIGAHPKSLGLIAQAEDATLPPASRNDTCLSRLVFLTCHDTTSYTV